MGPLTECSADDGVTLVATTGKQLQINPAWKNPTGKWRVGSKSLFELYPAGLVKRMTEKRKVRSLVCVCGVSTCEFTIHLFCLNPTNHACERRDLAQWEVTEHLTVYRSMRSMGCRRQTRKNTHSNMWHPAHST